LDVVYPSNAAVVISDSTSVLRSKCPRQIVSEIAERRAFLEDMRSKGQGKRYEDQILAEISGRLAELRRMGVTAEQPLGK
jgi:hypothetical protein